MFQFILFIAIASSLLASWSTMAMLPSAASGGAGNGSNTAGGRIVSFDWKEQKPKKPSNWARLGSKLGIMSYSLENLKAECVKRKENYAKDLAYQQLHAKQINAASLLDPMQAKVYLPTREYQKTWDALECAIVYEQMLEKIYPRIKTSIDELKPAYVKAKAMKTLLNDQLVAAKYGSQPQPSTHIQNLQMQLDQCQKTVQYMDHLKESLKMLEGHLSLTERGKGTLGDMYDKIVNNADLANSQYRAHFMAMFDKYHRTYSATADKLIRTYMEMMNTNNNATGSSAGGGVPVAERTFSATAFKPRALSVNMAPLPLMGQGNKQQIPAALPPIVPTPQLPNMQMPLLRAASSSNNLQQQQAAQIPQKQNVQKAAFPDHLFAELQNIQPDQTMKLSDGYEYVVDPSGVRLLGRGDEIWTIEGDRKFYQNPSGNFEYINGTYVPLGELLPQQQQQQPQQQQMVHQQQQFLPQQFPVVNNQIRVGSLRSHSIKKIAGNTFQQRRA